MRKWINAHMFELVFLAFVTVCVGAALIHFRGEARDFRTNCKAVGGTVTVQNASRGKTFICLGPDREYLFSEHI